MCILLFVLYEIKRDVTDNGINQCDNRRLEWPSIALLALINSGRDITCIGITAKLDIVLDRMKLQILSAFIMVIVSNKRQK